ADQACSHSLDWLHFVRKQTARFRVVRIGLEEVRGHGTKRSIGITFDRSDSQIGGTESAVYPKARLLLPVRFHRRGVNAASQFVLRRQLRIGSDIVVRR